jgi:hypothetical protein
MAATEEVNSLVLAALAAGGTSAVQVRPAAAAAAVIRSVAADSLDELHCCCMHLTASITMHNPGRYCAAAVHCHKLTDMRLLLCVTCCAVPAGSQPAGDVQQPGA